MALGFTMLSQCWIGDGHRMERFQIVEEVSLLDSHKGLYSRNGS